MNNRIGDIDDAKLGRMVKDLLVRIEGGGNLNIQRSPKEALSAPGVEHKELEQNWTVQTGSYGSGSYAYQNQQATLSHPDLGELLERLEVATRK